MDTAGFEVWVIVLLSLCSGASLGGLLMWVYMESTHMLRTRDEYMAWREREAYRHRLDEGDDGGL